MGMGLINTIGQYLHAEPVLLSTAANSQSSDGAPNATEVKGRVIDRHALGANQKSYLSAKLVAVVNVTSTGANAGVVSLTSRFLHSTSTSTADATALGSTGVVTTMGTTTTSTSWSGVHVQNVDLRTAKRYLIPYLTPNHTASSSGSLNYSAALVFGSPDELPSTDLGASVRVG